MVIVMLCVFVGIYKVIMRLMSDPEVGKVLSAILKIITAIFLIFFGMGLLTLIFSWIV